MGHEREGRTPKGTWGVREVCLCAVVFLAACTGSSKQNFEESADLVLSGSVGDGPIVGADITVEDAEGTVVFTDQSDLTASYQVNVPDGTYLPVTVRVTGGTDLVTGRPADFELQAVAFSSGDITLNASPLTTLAIETARCMGELTPANVDLAWGHIHDAMNVGWDRAIVQDPMGDPVEDTNITTVLIANEALGEVIRRTSLALASSSEPHTPDEVMSLLACDLADGQLNAVGRGVTPRTTMTLLTVSTAVRLEVIAGRLRVDGQPAESLLNDALRTVIPGSNRTVGSLPPNQALIDQTQSALGVLQILGSEPILDMAMVLDGATPETARNQLEPLITSSSENTLDSLGAQVALTDDSELAPLVTRQTDSLNAQRPIVSFIADDSSVVAGTGTRLSWAASDTEICLASGGWSGEFSATGTFQTPSLTQDTEYVLSCAGLGGAVTERIFVTVTAPNPDPDPVPAVSLSANQTIVDAGNTVGLNWSASNSDSCSASGAWSGSRSVSGSLVVGPLNANATFSLTCTGPGGSASDSVTITVNQPPPLPTVNLGALATSVERGSGTQLNWTSTNSAACTASGAWSGGRSLSGSAATGSLNGNSTFTLTCSGAGGSASDSVTVLVTDPAAPTLSFTASPSTIDSGDSATLNWSSSNTTSCTASGAWSGSRGTSGNQSVSPSANSTYSLSCSGAGGTVTDSVTIQVNQPPVPTLNLSASATTIDSGDSATLNWSSSNATSCTASGAWSGSRGTTGNQSVSPSADSTYSLSCSGAGGTVTDSVTIQVNQPPGPILNLSASATAIDSGDSATLNWSSSNATSCTASGAWSGSRGTTGNQSVAPTTDSTYTLSCTGNGDTVTDSVTIQVNQPPADPPTLSFSASETVVVPGTSITLTWSSTDTTSCSASGGWSGNRSLSGSTSIAINSATTFTLTCTGPGGNIVEMLTVNTLNPVSLNWVAPTENVDGSTLTDLAGYRIYWGTTSRNYTGMVDVPDTQTTSHTLDLASGDYYVAMTALDQEGNESTYSNEVLKTSQ